MSLQTMYDREVTVTPRVADGTDARGNEKLIDGTPVPEVRAIRQLMGTAEELEGRDQQELRWTYFLAATSNSGTVLPTSGRARITDGDETLEVDGEISAALRRRRGEIHHLVAKAYRIEG